MGRQCLLPLELADCLTDSPHFRQNLHAYEKELENTSASIKTLVKDIKEVLDAAKQLSRCQRTFATSLDKFQFDCIGGSQTDDEIVIAGSLKQFGGLINLIEEERQRMLDHGHKHILGALETFRRTHIGAAKEGRKKFEKQTQKFCASLERHLNLSTKKHEDQAMKEADASLEMEQRYFVQASLDYVCMLQEVQERKKFEFVETLLGCMYGWLTFYHQGHEVANDYKGQMTDLQMRLQKTREEFEATRSEVESLKNKMMLDVRQTKSLDAGTRQGYLYLLEKKAFGTTWTKHYCMYDKKSKNLSLIPYNQLTGKLSSTDQMVLKSCVRRMSDTIDRRFCFDVRAEERDGQVYTLQAMSEDDRRLWMDAMDGKEPTYSKYGVDQRTEETALDDNGFHFVSSCIAQLEGRGLEEQGLYRVVGVSSKVSKLVTIGLSRQKLDKLTLDNPVEWETKTLTSAIKTYFRHLPEPLMTFRLHHDFINAAKTDNKEVRVAEIHKLVRKLPKVNYRMLKILMQHAQNISRKSDKNLMSVSNLAVCFGPTLLRPEEETMAAIIDIKFCNAVVEIIIRHFDTIFSGGMVPSSVESNGQLHYSNGAVSGGQPPSKPGIISATAQPVQVTAYDAEQPSRSVRVAGSARRHHAPPPYAHPPPPVYAPTGQHPSPPAGPVAALAGATVAGLAAGAADPARDGRQKPLHVFNPAVLSERERLDGGSLANNSMSSSNESLSSRSSRDLHQTTTSSGSSPYTRGKLGIIYPPSYRSQPDPSLPSPVASAAPSNDVPAGQSLPRRVRTLYACVGENESELSFEPNQIITNVRPSREPGWLEGTLNGHPGLVPENYVEYLP